MIYSLFLILLFLTSCTKELDISEFSNDFIDYAPELRIEALILPSENTAVVRIDRSVLINDTLIYNCRDDDFGEISQDSCNTLSGIWHGNELDEIADCGDWDPLIHDIGEDGKEGDPTDENQNCTTEDYADCEASDDCDKPDCLLEDSIGENNGIPNCGEPNVDETDEIIKNLHIEDCSIKIINKEVECILEYDESADSLFYDSNISRDDFSIDNILTPHYSAYTPSASCSDFNWNDFDGEYEFEANCPNYEIVVSKSPIQIPPPVVFHNDNDVFSESGSNQEFKTTISDCQDNECLKNNSSIWDNTTRNYNTIYFGRYAFNDYIYYSSISPYFYYQSVQYFYDKDNNRYLYYHGHPDGATEVENIIGNAALMSEAIVTDFLEFDNTPIINQYYYEMFTFSESYKDYYYFDLLDLKDPIRSNLRKANTNETVMGAFGAMTSSRIYFEIIDCLEYVTKDECEDIDKTKAVCQWYDQNNNYGDLNNNNQYDIGENYVPTELLPLCGPIKMPPISTD